MTERSRHGLHVVRDGVAPAGHPTTPAFLPAPRRPSLELAQRSVVLAVGGQLNADTSARLRMFLTMFTIAGGPREVVLDLSNVYAVDEDGMAPIFEADETMRLRKASLRLAPVSTTVAHYLEAELGDRTLAIGPPAPVLPGPSVRPVVSGPDDDHAVPGQD